jgi:hypothetical protein
MSVVKIFAVNVRAREVMTQFHCAIFALVLLTICPLRVLAQDGQSRVPALQHQEQVQDEGSKANALVQIVRESTERFKDVSVAEHAGYALQFGCVGGPDYGAMGLHFVNGSLINGGEVDATRPQIVIYEPTADGNLRLIGADYLVLADAWDKKNQGPPQLMGQLFQYWESPNRFGLPAFYTLHVWAWKDNPNGAFVNWHPKVRCEAFGGQTP